MMVYTWPSTVTWPTRATLPTFDPIAKVTAPLKMEMPIHEGWSVVGENGPVRDVVEGINGNRVICEAVAGTW